MKILYLFREEWEKEYIKDKLPGANLRFADSIENTAEEDLRETEVLSVFISHPVTKEVLDKMPNLKLIATKSTGYDHIDLAAAREKGVEAVYVPSYGENTVAEFTFALILALARKLRNACEQVSLTGSWSQVKLRGFDLNGKKIGIVGTGRIGINVIRIAKGFGMEVIAYDPFPKQDLAQEMSFEYVGFEELLSRSDIISLHAPLSDKTFHMINAGSAQKIKPGAIFVNTARGGLVETAALVKALENGIISAAGLDVLEEEGDMGEEEKLISDPHPKLEELKNVLSNHYLINSPQVIITPHIAFNTEEAVRRILDTTADNIASFEKGEVKNKIPN